MSVILPFVFFLFDADPGSQPSWFYPVLTALGLSIVANISVFFKWLLSKPDRDARSLGELQDDLTKLVGRYSHLANKVADGEWDSDRRYRKLRNGILDFDDLFETIIPRLAGAENEALIDNIRLVRAKHKKAFDEEVALEKARADRAAQADNTDS